MKKYNPEIFKSPFDILMLPSMGAFYSNKKSTFKVKYLTAKEEILLCTPSISEDIEGLQMLLDIVILDDDFEDIGELLVCDKNALLIYLFSTTFGDKLPWNLNCPHCNSFHENSFNLSNLSIKENLILPDEDGTFSYKIKNFKVKGEPAVIKFRPLKFKEELLIDENNPVERMFACIVQLNDITDKSIIKKYLEMVPIKESSRMREYINKVEPGFNENIILNCTICSKPFTQSFKIGNSFLRLPPEHKQTIDEEVFLGVYYGKGYTRADLYEMTTHERKWTINRIVKEIEKQNEAEKKAMDKAKSKR